MTPEGAFELEKFLHAAPRSEGDIDRFVQHMPAKFFARDADEARRAEAAMKQQLRGSTPEARLEDVLDTAAKKFGGYADRAALEKDLGKRANLIAELKDRIETRGNQPDDVDRPEYEAAVRGLQEILHDQPELGNVRFKPVSRWDWWWPWESQPLERAGSKEGKTLIEITGDLHINQGTQFNGAYRDRAGKPMNRGLSGRPK